MTVIAPTSVPHSVDRLPPTRSGQHLYLHLEADGEKDAADALLHVAGQVTAGILALDSADTWNIVQADLHAGAASEQESQTFYSAYPVPDEGGCLSLVLNADGPLALYTALTALASELRTGECDLTDRQGAGWNALLCEYSERLDEDDED